MAIFGMRNTPTICLLYACLGASFYGYDSGISASVIAYESFIYYLKLDSTTIGSINSAYGAASACGMLLNWYLPNKLGRLKTIQIACLISFLGVSLQTGAQNYPQFIIGRVFGGIACGLMVVLCPVYVSEISAAHLRGRVGGLYGLILSVSYMITEWLGLAFFFIPGNASWRVLYGLQLLPAIAMLLGSFWMPESPRWLALTGRYDECLRIIRMVSNSQSEDDILQQFHQIKYQIEEDKSDQSTIRTILGRKTYIRRIGLIALFFFAQACVGIIPLSTYQVTIYNIIGFDEQMSLVLTGVSGSVSAIAVLSLGFLFDHIGRRNAIFMAYSIIIPASTMIVVLWSEFERDGYQNIALGKGVVLGIFLVTFGYWSVMPTFGSLYAAEIMPTHVRPVGVACGYFVTCAVSTVLSQITPIALESISWRFFLIFLVIDCCFVFSFFFIYPETKVIAPHLYFEK